MEKNKIVRLVVSIFLFGLLSVGYSQVQKIKVLDIRIEGSERQDIIRTSGLTKGDLISMDDVQNAIKRLWSRQLFSDVQVEIEKQVGDGVFLLIRVKEYPRLVTEKFLEFHGNKKIKDKKFEEELALEAGQVMSDWAISRAKRKMLEMYHEKGYLLAKVVPETFSSTQGNDRVILRFDITEGNKVQVKKILFKGNNGFSDGKLRKQMEETKEDTWYRGADFDEEQYEADKILVLDFYRNNGYRDAEIVSDSLYYMNDLKDMYIEITVNEGRQYKFGKITFEGNSAFSEDELRQNLTFVEGDVYSQEELTKTQQERLGNLYYDNGYIFSNVPWKETPVGDDVVDIHWFISEGKPAKVGRIEIAGNTRTMDKVIRRELRIYPGEIFSKDKVARSQREVHMLNYFSDVQIQPVPAEEDLINLKFTVKEKSTDTAHMSAGYSERDKLIGNIGVAMNNLFGTGQRLSFDWNFGKYYRSFQISYTEPWLFDTPTLGGISFYDTKRELSYYQPFEENSRGASVRMGRRFHWPDNYFRGDWIYGLARYNYSNFEDWYLESYPYGIASMQWPLTISSFTQIISRNSFDMPEFPTRGSEFSYSFELAGTVLGGDSNFQKHMLSMKWFTPIWWKFVLYNNFMTGWINGIGDDPDVPTHEFFYMGGDGLTSSIPLRGYDDPYSGSWATSSGGRVAMKFSTEFRVQILPNPTMYGLIFAEAGETWHQIEDTDPLSMRRSVGIGARLFMPMVGILGFDYAYGFDYFDANGNRYGKWMPHFVLGKGF